MSRTRHKIGPTGLRSRARFWQHRKDVDLVLEVPAEKEAELAGLGELDKSAIIEVLRKSRSGAKA